LKLVLGDLRMIGDRAYLMRSIAVDHPTAYERDDYRHSLGYFRVVLPENLNTR
jgi:hypothetical protein